MKTGYAIGRAVENTFLVRERDRRRWLDLAVVLGTIVPIGAALVSYAWVHLEVVETGYRIAQLERQRAELQEEERRARLEISRLLQPERLERLAETSDLAAPSVEQVLFVQPEESSAAPPTSSASPGASPAGLPSNGAADRAASTRGRS